MKRTLFFIGLSLCMNMAFAQKGNPAKYAKLISEAELKKHLTIIAGDEFEGRETGTEGQRKAAAYIESQFKAWGLKQAPSFKNTYQQLYPLFQDSLIKSELMVNGVTAEPGKDFISIINQNENGSFKASEVVFVGYGIDDPAYSDYGSVNVKGKVVIFFSGEPRKDGKYFINPTGRSSEWTFPGNPKKMAAAAARGAVGALVINPSQDVFSARAIENSKRTNVYYPRKEDETKRVAFAVLSHAFARSFFPNTFDTVLAKIKAQEVLPPAQPSEATTNVSFSFQKYRNVINASNVLGIVEGSDKKDEYIFVTGHYDHLGKHDGKIYYGADDDGSGTVAVMQMGAAFAKAKAEGNGPRRTMVFMTVSGEEKGLWGSEYYSDNPVFPLEKTSVDLNIDMIGRVDTERMTADSLNYVYVVGHDKISSDLPIINEAENNKTTKLVLDYKFDDPNDKERIYFRSDHYNFARKGVPVLFFYDGMLKADYHKPTDTVDKINWALYAKRAQMIFYTAWEMANRDGMLVRDKPLPTATR